MTFIPITLDAVNNVREMSMYNHPSNTTLHGKKEHMFQPTKFTRKSFEVEAIQVRPQNIKEVAEWVGGVIRHRRGKRDNDNVYVKVEVIRPLNERQTRAYIGDWILKGKNGYKVYTDNAFHNSFVESVDGADAPYLVG